MALWLRALAALQRMGGAAHNHHNSIHRESDALFWLLRTLRMYSVQTSL